MYKVFGGKRSRTMRVLWALEEMELEYEHIAVSPRSDEVRALNPSGKIPAFMDGDDVLIDSLAIIQYLADKHGKLTFAAGTIARAQQDSFTQFVTDEMDGTLWTAARNSFVLPEERRVPEIKDTLKWEYDNSMKTLSKRLGDNEFLMGETLTVPDIVAAHCGMWAKNAGFRCEPENVIAYLDRMLGRPAYLRLTAK